MKRIYLPAIALLLSGCGYVDVAPNVKEKISSDAVVTSDIGVPTVTAHDTWSPEGLTLQSGTLCNKEVSNPHQSGHNNAEIITKGQLTCGPNSEAIRAYITVYMWYASGTLYRKSSTQTLDLSRYLTVRSPWNLNVAAGPCIPGYYYGSIGIKYVNLTGGVVSYSPDLYTTTVYEDCIY